MKLKNSQIVQGVLALRAIPTLRRSPKGGYAFTKTLRVLTDAVEPYEETRRALFKDIFAGAPTVDETHPHWTEWAKSVKALDETQTEVAVHQCSREDLNLADKANPEGNDIDHKHLAQIWFVLSDW